MSNFLERAAYEWTEDSVRIIATPSVAARNTFFYVQEIGEFQTKRGYFTEREHLPSYLFVYTKSGKGTLKYNGKTYEVGPNQFFFIDCMDYHFYKTNENELWEILWVHFNGPMCPGYYQIFRRHDSPSVTVLPDSKIPAIMNQLLQLYQGLDIRTELVSSKLLTDLLTEIILSVETMETSNFLIPDYLKKVINYIEKRFNEKISLDNLSMTYSISKYHLVREFKKYTGTSPNEYLINCRISYAKNLLQYSDLSVSEVSLLTGIDNVSHFINLFKVREGVTPLSFRKKWRNRK